MSIIMWRAVVHDGSFLDCSVVLSALDADGVLVADRDDAGTIATCRFLRTDRLLPLLGADARPLGPNHSS